jgi:hypothetical protein
MHGPIWHVLARLWVSAVSDCPGAAGQVLVAPRAIGEWLIAIGVLLFIALSALYGIKTDAIRAL